MTAEMKRCTKWDKGAESKPRRQQFADGSAIVTYPDGTRAILESSLAKPVALHQEKPVNYRNRHGRCSYQPYERG
jgi:hypothetical protein